MKKLIVLGFLVLAFCTIARAQAKPQQRSAIEAPLKVSLCELKNDPAVYNHKLIEVTGFVSHGFENFSIFDPECGKRWSGIWLEYGGKEVSGTMYCCGVTDARTRPQQLVVEKIPIPLEKDENFRTFDKLLQRPPDSIARATIQGRFFAGKKQVFPKATFWGGYGHMGCCSLFAIQKIVSVDAEDNSDLDYRASADQPHGPLKATGYTFLKVGESLTELTDLQKKADSGTRDWSFNDPQRVAAETFAQITKTDEKSVNGIKEIKKAQGRYLYKWTNKATEIDYMIVVSRPYWLSFYAKDPKKVVWVTIAAYEITQYDSRP